MADRGQARRRPRQPSPRRPTQKADAKAKADAALKDLQSGKAWEDVAKTVSTDASTAPQAGDLGWIEGTGGSADPDFLKALFAADVNAPTAVVEGADGTYRIGRVTEIAPESVDTAYQAKIVNDGVQPRQVPRRPRRGRPPRQAPDQDRR